MPASDLALLGCASAPSLDTRAFGPSPDAGGRRGGRARSSPGWTRTNNPSVNSRMLCQLSYRGRRRSMVAATGACRRARVRPRLCSPHPTREDLKMKLYVCWGTFKNPLRPGGHPCGNAYHALKDAGHDPEVVKAYGLAPLPDVTSGRKEVK